MAEQTAISWADATFNPWIGCTKVSTGPQGACEKCYAERDNKRRGWVPGWGPGVPRRRTKTWGEPLKWNRRAIETGYRPRVFCASLADVFDNEVDDSWRVDLWQLLRETQNLRWMLLTKRIGNAPKMLPPDWTSGIFDHVGLMATLATQAEWDRDIWKLMSIPATWHGVSVEPMLGPVSLKGWRPDWIIGGGESGPGFRYTDPAWVCSLQRECDDAGIAFHFKQWGGTRPKENGCALNGREYKEFPPALAA